MATPFEISRHASMHAKEDIPVNKNAWNVIRATGNPILTPSLEDRATPPSILNDHRLVTAKDNKNSNYVLLKDDVYYIDTGAFENETALLGLALPAALSRIGYAAFQNCTRLQIVTTKYYSTKPTIPVGMPLYLTSDPFCLGGRAFAGCTNLTHIELPPLLQKIEAFAFDGCKQLKQIQIQEGVATIGMGAFLNCSALENIVLPKSATVAGKSAFSGCTSLRRIKKSKQTCDQVDQPNPSHTTKTDKVAQRFEFYGIYENAREGFTFDYYT